MWESSRNQLRELFDWIIIATRSAVDLVVTTFDSLTEAIKKPFRSAFEWVMSYYDKTIGKIASLWATVKGTVSGMVDSVKATIGMDVNTSAAAPNPANSGQMGTRVTPTIHGGDVKATINIHATNALDAQRGVERGLSNANRQAMANLKGVLR